MALWRRQRAEPESGDEMAGAVVTVLVAVIDAREKAFQRAADMGF